MKIPEHNYTPRERTVCKILEGLPTVRSMLNIGMRNPADERNNWWLKICRANGTEPHVLEVFELNCQELRAHGVPNVAMGDVRKIGELFAGRFDIILWWHGPEHLEKSEALRAIQDVDSLADVAVIIGTPLGHEPQEACYGNMHEQHLSGWQPDEFEALGFETMVVKDGQAYGHITAWKVREGERRAGRIEDRRSKNEDREMRTENRRSIGDEGHAGVCGTGSASAIPQAVDWTRHWQSQCRTRSDSQCYTDAKAPVVAVDSGNVDDERMDSKSETLAFITGSRHAKNQAIEIRCVAVVFDDELRPETTGVYCRRALEEIVEVQHIRPSDLSAFSPSDFDLFLRIDDGLEYGLPRELRPSAWWAIDTHLNFPSCLARARQFDFVFAAQRDGAERMKAQGIETATWLPLGCDPEIHRKYNVEKQFDVCFVGNEFPGQRADLLRLIQRKFVNSFVGQLYMDEMAKMYSASRVVFNRSVENDVNMRVFEALACGSLLVTNDLSDNGQTELFRSGVHLETYRDADELIDKIRYYVTHEEIRERIADAGRREVLAGHTYRHRMEALLQRIQGSGFRVRGSEIRSQRSEIGGQTAEDSRRHTTGRTGLNAEPVDLATTQLLNSSGWMRDRSYFDHARPELVALVPESARRVLDIGCAAGRLGEQIKARQPATVVGVELQGIAAAEARNRLDEVIVGNIEEIEPTFEAGSFDCIVCGDILEHLEDPEAVLARVRRWLAPAGRLVASIPNVRHHSVIRSLLDGNWTYEPAGLLDRDHVRFFTRREIDRVFQEAGFQIDHMQCVPGPGYDEWEEQGRPGHASVGRLHVGGLTTEEAEEFYIYQFLVVASPRALVPITPTTVRHGEERLGGGNPHSEGGDRCELLASPPLLADSSRPVPSPRLRQEGLGVRGRRRSRMRFSQDFTSDFDQFDFWGEPFAFARFGDGERAICEGRAIKAQDGWCYDGNGSPFGSDLNASLRFSDPHYYIGISDACCDLASKEWYLRQIVVPFEQVTFANIFVNWNYRRFRKLDLRGMAIVSSGRGDFFVPDDLVRGNFDIDGLVDQLLSVDRPILVAAGPASCIIAHKYWIRSDPARRQTIVDVGSAIDELTKGRKTRQYQVAGTRTAELICRW